MSLMDAAREFQKFMGYDEDDLPLYTIKAQYYRVQKRNKERMKLGEKAKIPDDDSELVEMLQSIQDQLNELNKKSHKK